MSARMQPAKRWPFQGELLTVAEVCARYPAFSNSFVRRALAGGATTLAELAQAREAGKRRQQNAQKFSSSRSPWRKGMPGLRRNA